MLKNVNWPVVVVPEMGKVRGRHQKPLVCWLGPCVRAHTQTHTLFTTQRPLRDGRDFFSEQVRNAKKSSTACAKDPAWLAGKVKWRSEVGGSYGGCIFFEMQWAVWERL